MANMPASPDALSLSQFLDDLCDEFIAMYEALGATGSKSTLSQSAAETVFEAAGNPIAIGTDSEKNASYHIEAFYDAYEVVLSGDDYSGLKFYFALAEIDSVYVLYTCRSSIFGGYRKNLNVVPVDHTSATALSAEIQKGAVVTFVDDAGQDYFHIDGQRVGSGVCKDAFYFDTEVLSAPTAYTINATPCEVGRTLVCGTETQNLVASVEEVTFSVRTQTTFPAKVVLSATEEPSISEEVFIAPPLSEQTKYVVLTGATPTLGVITLPDEEGVLFYAGAAGMLPVIGWACDGRKVYVPLNTAVSYAFTKEGCADVTGTTTLYTGSPTVTLDPTMTVTTHSGDKVTLTALDGETLIPNVLAYKDDGITIGPFEILEGLWKTKLGTLPIDIDADEKARYSFYKEGWYYYDYDPTEHGAGDIIDLGSIISVPVGAPVVKTITITQTEDTVDELHSLVAGGFELVGEEFPRYYTFVSDDPVAFRAKSDLGYLVFNLDPNNFTGGETVDLSELIPAMVAEGIATWTTDGLVPSGWEDYLGALYETAANVQEVATGGNAVMYAGAGLALGVLAGAFLK